MYSRYRRFAAWLGQKRPFGTTAVYSNCNSAKNVSRDVTVKVPDSYNRTEKADTLRKRTEISMEREESINEILAYYRGREDKKEQEVIVAMLRELQEVCGGVSPALQERAASVTGVKVSVVKYLVRMYSGLKETPYEHTVTVCTGKRCRDKGGAAVLQAVRKELDIKKEGISADGKVYLSVQGCLRNCGKSPNLLIDGKMFSGVRPEQIADIFKKCF